MMRSKAKREKKDKKISKKKKAEVKNSDEKKVGKKKEESQLEEEIEEAEDEKNISGFFPQFPPVKFSPVLEKAARTQETNLEQQISNIPVRKNEEERVIRYGGEKSNYETAKPDEGRIFQYAETPTTYDVALSEKKRDVVDFNAPRQKWETSERKETMTKMERAGFEEMRSENSGKKYLTKRKY